MTTPQQIRDRAEAAQSRFEKAEAELYRDDGQKRYSDTEHRERMNALRAERETTCKEVFKLAEEECAALKDRVEDFKARDLSALLSTEEMNSASARRGFITAEVSDMDQDELAARLRSVINGSSSAAPDIAGQYLHLVAAREYTRKARASGRAVIGVSGLADELEATLFGGRAGQELSEAEDRHREMSDSSMLALRLQNGARNAGEAFNEKLKRKSSLMRF